MHWITTHAVWISNRLSFLRRKIGICIWRYRRSRETERGSQKRCSITPPSHQISSEMSRLKPIKQPLSQPWKAIELKTLLLRNKLRKNDWKKEKNRNLRWALAKPEWENLVRKKMQFRFCGKFFWGKQYRCSTSKDLITANELCTAVRKDYPTIIRQWSSQHRAMMLPGPRQLWNKSREPREHCEF